MRTKLTKNKSSLISTPMRNTIIWIIINSLLVVNVASLNIEIPQPTSERQDEAIVTSTILNNLEQNLSERQSRLKNFEKYNSVEIIASLGFQNLLTPDEADFITLLQSFLSINSSTKNNHSLRSPPALS